MHNVAIIGASNCNTRYANRAQIQLMQKGYKVYPVTKKDSLVLGITAYKQLSDITDPIDTVTVYVNPTILSSMLNQLIALKPCRVIFNPDTESPEIEQQLITHGIHVVNACTLVLLSTNQFDIA